MTLAFVDTVRGVAVMTYLYVAMVTVMVDVYLIRFRSSPVAGVYDYPSVAMGDNWDALAMVPFRRTANAASGVLSNQHCH